MTWGFVAAGAATVVGGYMSSSAQEDAANTAAGAQNAASQAGIAETQRQFDATKQLLSPYVQTGTQSLEAQRNLIGLGGGQAQQQAIAALQASPQFTMLQQQGEEAILQNASATGGLRGGNTQGALAQFRPQLLNQLIQQQYAQLGGMTSLGQNAAAGVGNAGMQTGSAISGLLQQGGAAQAGAALAGGRASADMWGNVAGAVGQFAGQGGFQRIGNYQADNSGLMADMKTYGVF